MEVQEKKEVKTYDVVKKLSLRRKKIFGLPGSDPTEAKMFVGGAIHHRGALRGLDHNEEEKYLPAIIGISPNDNNWNSRVQNYWNSIREAVPADSDGSEEYPGRYIEFVIQFTDSKVAKAFKDADNFDKAGELSKLGTCVRGVEDYIFFRYCLVNGRVANSFKDVNKSRKIHFYLYSKDVEISDAHSKMQMELKSSQKFAEIITDEKLVDGVLRLLALHPEHFTSISEKHMALFNKSKESPKVFLDAANDPSLKYKSLILKAVHNNIIHRPALSDSYYYGDNQDVYLGGTLDDAVAWFKHATEGKNKEIKDAINARLKELD